MMMVAAQSFGITDCFPRRRGNNPMAVEVSLGALEEEGEEVERYVIVLGKIEEKSGTSKHVFGLSQRSMDLRFVTYNVQPIR